MRAELSAEEIARYREQGFLVIDDFLDTAEVQWLRDVLAGAVEARGDARMPGELAAQTVGARVHAAGGEGAPVTDTSVGRRLLDALGKHRAKWVRVLDQYVNLWQTDEQVRRFSLDPRLGRIACELAGVDGVRIWHDQTMIKPAWGEPTGWHTDTPVFSFTHPGASTFWFALVDADLRNGCMHYIAGSHKARVTARGNMRIDALRLLDPEWEFAEPVACPVRAGAMIVHNGDTAHGAGANMTPAPRIAFAISWMPVGSTFNGNPNILPADVLARLRPGDPLDLDDLNPVVYER
jgi:ectoine hydroxylase-related dioxygenase (phytanoyl-CoA dioxygenase family)